MKLKVLSVAYPFAPVRPACAGGAEQVLRWVEAATARAGHDSMVLACPGSIVHGTLIAGPDIPRELTPEARANVHIQFRELIQEILIRTAPDIVHMHGVDFAEYLPDTDCPVLVTLHLPISWYPPHAFTNVGSQVAYHCVSYTQHRDASRIRCLLSPIPNGVPRIQAHGPRRDYALCLGRICPEKGYHLAIAACRSAGIPLWIAGTLFPYPEHQNYFQEQIRPYLGPEVQMLAEVGPEQKAKLLAEARCVLIPSLVPETSSLVAMESLSAGTPVIAFDSGALPEIVEHARTGFVVQDMEEMAAAIPRAHEISSELCRTTAARRFDLERMTSQYLHRYETLVGREEAPHAS